MKFRIDTPVDFKLPGGETGHGKVAYMNPETNLVEILSPAHGKVTVPAENVSKVQLKINVGQGATHDSTHEDLVDRRSG